MGRTEEMRVLVYAGNNLLGPPPSSRRTKASLPESASSSRFLSRRETKKATDLAWQLMDFFGLNSMSEKAA